ncbi:F-box protein GID2-like [Miscanthus floridulus]|uniref:F-box protein GID2-like n=1 Tax=Miscanthus floridulus TaxID=154761 RepID=UPI00345848E7
MKCRSDSSGSGGDDPRPPAPAATGEPSKKQRTEGECSSSSSIAAGECSSSFSQAPPPPVLPKDARVDEPAPPPPPGSEPGGGEQVRVPDLGEDLVFEVLMRAEARTLAAAACVSRGWRVLARDERLWEAACLRDWAYTGFSEQMLRSVVLSLGGFRRLHEMYIRPVQQRAAGAPPAGQQQRRQLPVRMGRDQVQVSLSLLSTSFFLKMPDAPPSPPKDKDKDTDKNGGGQCG